MEKMLLSMKELTDAWKKIISGTLITFFAEKNVAKKILLFPPGLEPGTSSVLDSRDNPYTTETTALKWIDHSWSHFVENIFGIATI